MSRALVLVLAAVVAAGGVGAWLLLGDDGVAWDDGPAGNSRIGAADPAGAREPGFSSPARAPAEGPTALAGAPEPTPADDAAAAPTGTPWGHQPALRELPAGPEVLGVELSGRVVEPGGAPVAGAEVLLLVDRRLPPLMEPPREAPTEPDAVSATSDAEGRFRLATAIGVVSSHSRVLTAPSELRVLVVAPGMATRRYRIRPGEVTIATTVEHQERGEAFAYPEVTLLVERGSSVAGRVLDDRGRPVPGAEVLYRLQRVDPAWKARDKPGLELPESFGTVRRGWSSDKHSTLPEALRRGLTDDEGRFRIDGLWPGLGRCEIRARGFLHQRVADIEVPERADVDIGPVGLSPGGRVAGRVVDDGGAPVPGATVLLTEPLAASTPAGLSVRPRGRLPETVTGTDGRFVFTGVDDGAHAILVHADGHAPGLIRDVAAGLEDLELTLRPVTAWHLRLRAEEDGSPVVGVEVTAMAMGADSADELAGERIELEAVRFLGRQLPTRPVPDAPGEVLVLHPGEHGTAARITAPGRATRHHVLPPLGPDGTSDLTVEPIDIVLPPEGRVAGAVVDDRGEPVPFAEVRTAPEQDSSQLPRRTEHNADAEGRFDIGGLDAGAITVRARTRDHAETVLPLQLERAERRDDLRLVIPREGRLEGRVVGASAGGPWAPFDDEWSDDLDVAVVDLETEERVRTLGVRDDGGFVWTGARPGRYRLELPSTEEVVVEIPPGETVTVDLAAPTFPVLTGRVLEADGAPRPGAWIEVLDEASAATQLEPGASTGSISYLGWENGRFGSFHSDAVTDAQGRFVVGVQQAGRVFVRATFRSSTTAPVPVTLAQGAVAEVTLTLGGGRLEGRVVDAADGTPIEDAVINTLPHGATRTGADGRFVVEHLQPGLVSVGVRHSSYLQREELLVRVVGSDGVTGLDKPAPVGSDGRPRQVLEPPVEIALVAAARVTGTIRTAVGAPAGRDVRVRLVPLPVPGGPTWQRATWPKNEGRFDVGAVPAGAYTLYVLPAGTIANDELDQRALLVWPVDVTSGETLQLDLVLPAR